MSLYRNGLDQYDKHYHLSYQKGCGGSTILLITPNTYWYLHRWLGVVSGQGWNKHPYTHLSYQKGTTVLLPLLHGSDLKEEENNMVYPFPHPDVGKEMRQYFSVILFKPTVKIELALWQKFIFYFLQLPAHVDNLTVFLREDAVPMEG